MNQATFNKSGKISGKSIHNGKQVTVTVSPAAEDYGIVFMSNNELIKLSECNYIAENNTTAICNSNGACVLTTEHFLSTLYIFGITNCIVSIEGDNELPIMDSSASKWIEMFESLGKKQQKKVDTKILKINKDITFHTGISEYQVAPSSGFTITCEIDFPNVIIGNQNVYFDGTYENYKSSFSSARSFLKDLVNGEKIDKLSLSQRLRGYHYSEEGFSDTLILYNQNEYLTPLRMKDEPARHKLLDFIGDIYSSGYRFIGNFSIKKPGHKNNLLFLDHLKTLLLKSDQ